ncbi:MAG: hypothetical protein EBX40_00415, partial [Gammaproteobacteria bacterium]|nr:hypothetical protein [Gammaproteobacteria bacterium]
MFGKDIVTKGEDLVIAASDWRDCKCDKAVRFERRGNWLIPYDKKGLSLSAGCTLIAKSDLDFRFNVQDFIDLLASITNNRADGNGLAFDVSLLQIAAAALGANEGKVHLS